LGSYQADLKLLGVFGGYLMQPMARISHKPYLGKLKLTHYLKRELFSLNSLLSNLEHFKISQNAQLLMHFPCREERGALPFIGLRKRELEKPKGI